MSDLIRRQGALDALQCEWCEEKINNLPSIDAVQIPIKLEKRYPQSRDEDITDAFMRGYLAGRSSARPKGEWIVSHGVFAYDGKYGDMWHCSECGLSERDVEGKNFCWNCGARMGGK